MLCKVVAEYMAGGFTNTLTFVIAGNGIFYTAIRQWFFAIASFAKQIVIWLSPAIAKILYQNLF